MSILNGSDGRHVVIVANGEFHHTDRLGRLLAGADVIIAADGGANWLATLGWVPDVLVGDLDSVQPRVLDAVKNGRCRIVRHATHKDETDTELALLEATAMGAERITLLGALGGRIDHALGNVMLLTMDCLAPIKARIYDGTSYLSIVRDCEEVRGRVGDTVSLIPLRGDALGVVAQGLEYPLRDETLAFGPARGISNVLSEPTARVTLREGLLLIVHTPRCEYDVENCV